MMPFVLYITFIRMILQHKKDVQYFSVLYFIAIYLVLSYLGCLSFASVPFSILFC